VGDLQRLPQRSAAFWRSSVDLGPDLTRAPGKPRGPFHDASSYAAELSVVGANISWRTDTRRTSVTIAVAPPKNRGLAKHGHNSARGVADARSR
jgi:hypothetical protein